MDRKLFVTIIRHGETKLNLQRVLQGHTDTPLSDIGIRQAEVLGKKMAKEKFTKAFSSDLQRAYDTALTIMKYSEQPKDVIKDKLLRERCYGEAEGKSVQTLSEEASKLNIKMADYTPIDGESPTEVMIRAKSFFQSLCDLLEISPDDEENILVLSHGGWLLHFMKFLYENPERYNLQNFDKAKAFKIPRNTGVFKFTVSLDQKIENDETPKRYLITFSCIDDASHLSN